VQTGTFELTATADDGTPARVELGARRQGA